MPTGLAFDCRLFRGVLSGFRDDNFKAGWVRLFGNGSFVTDGDIVTITNGSGAAAEEWSKTVPGALSTTTYTTMVARGRQISGGVTVVVEVLYTAGSGGGSNNVIFTTTSFDTKEVTLTTSRIIAEVRIRMNAADAGASGAVDFEIIEKSSHLNLTPDLVGLNVSRYLGWRVGLAEIGLQDFGDTYWNASNISSADILLLYAGTVSTSLSKIFGGLVHKKKKPGILDNRYTILNCVDWTKALESVIVDKRYVASQEDVIVDDLRDIVNGAAASPYNNDTYWRLSEQAITDVLNKTYTLEWRQLPAMDALTELAEIISIDTASGKGADFVVYPSAWLNWDEIGDTGFTDHGTFGETTYQSFDPEAGLDDLRTQVNLIGRVIVPSDGDDWTESTTGWTVSSGDTITTSSTIKSVGTVSVFFFTTDAAVASIVRSIGTIDFTKMGGKLIPPSLVVYLLRHQNIDLVQIRLEKDASNYFQIDVTTQVPIFAATEIPARFSIFVGPDSVDRWIKTGTLTWAEVVNIRIRINDTAGTGQMFVDGLHFEGNVVEIAKDSRTNKGESQYGKRELTVYDPTPREVTSTTGGQGHRERAKAELFKWRDEIVNAKLFMRNKLNIHPADKLAITSTPHNYSAKSFRVVGVNYFWASGMSSIDTVLDLTDFNITTFPRGAGALYGLLVRQGFLGRYETLLTSLRENELVGGITSNTTSYS